MSRPGNLWRRFLKDERGGIAIMSVLLLPVTIGFVALVGEYGNGLLGRAENQRVADIAAYAGALAYLNSKDTSDMTNAANRAAELNGIPSSSVTAGLVPSPRGIGEAVAVSISTQQQLILATIVGADTSMEVRANAIAEFSGGSNPACLIALDGSLSGITLSGGTSIQANDCAVASNATISVPCGTSIIAEEVSYNSATTPLQPCNGIRAPGGGAPAMTKAAVEDPFAGNAAIGTATGRITGVRNLTAPPAPIVSGGFDIDFGWDQGKTTEAAGKIRCTASWASPKWTLTCPRGGTYYFGKLTMGGGISLEVKLSGTSLDATTFNASGEILLSAAAASFPAANYNLARGITTSGNMIATFGAGAYKMGRSATSCNGAFFSICQNGSSLKFEGGSAFELSSGVYNKGGSTLVMGTGSGNSFKIGASSAGDAVSMGGGSKTSFGDATPSGLFQLAGNLNMASGGGSCLSIGAAVEHDIAGFLSAAGGIRLGAGRYTIDGYMALGASGGGNVTCDGETIGVLARDVTIVLSGKTTPVSGSCAGKAFCIGAGYGSVVLKAPTSGSMMNLAVIGPSANTSGATVTEGGNAQISGAFYFPKGPVTLSGGAAVSGGADECLQLIAAQLTLSGGAKAFSSCKTDGGSGGGSKIVTLVR